MRIQFRVSTSIADGWHKFVSLVRNDLNLYSNILAYHNLLSGPPIEGLVLSYYKSTLPAISIEVEPGQKVL